MNSFIDRLYTNEKQTVAYRFFVYPNLEEAGKKHEQGRVVRRLPARPHE